MLSESYKHLKDMIIQLPKCFRKIQKQVIESVKEIITNCTFGAIDVNKLPLFDIEYIFIKLRAKSGANVAKTPPNKVL